MTLRSGSLFRLFFLLAFTLDANGRERGASGITCCDSVTYKDKYGPGGEVDVDAKVAIADLKSSTPFIYRSQGPYYKCRFDLNYPYYTRPVYEWAKIRKAKSSFLVNANFYYWVPITYNTYCNMAIGPTKGRNEARIPPERFSLIHGQPTQTLALKKDGTYSIFESSAANPSSNLDANVIAAVAGVQFITKGSYNAAPDYSKLDPQYRVPRAAIGFTADQKAVVVVVNNGDNSDHGSSIEGLADYMTGPQHVVEGLLLDGSGSAQLVTTDASGVVTKVTPPSDKPRISNTRCAEGYGKLKKCYRPVPVVLGFR